jgi:hypothetical protein
MKDFRNRLAPLASPLLALALCGWMPQAMATAPNDAQIDQLLEVTRSRATLEAMLPQIEASQQQMLQQMLAGTTLDAKQREMVDRIFARSRTLMSEALAWEKMLPVYRQLYGEAFTAEDVQALIEFYRSPAGQRLLDKMPLLMQKTMVAMQQIVVPMMQQLQQEIAREVASPAAPPAPPKP